jgi:hypothetical protein
MALTPMKARQGEGRGFMKEKSRREHYVLDSASSRHGAGRRGGQRRPDLVDAGGGR